MGGGRRSLQYNNAQGQNRLQIFHLLAQAAQKFSSLHVLSFFASDVTWKLRAQVRVPHDDGAERAQLGGRLREPAEARGLVCALRGAAGLRGDARQDPPGPVDFLSLH